MLNIYYRLILYPPDSFLSLYMVDILRALYWTWFKSFQLVCANGTKGTPRDRMPGSLLSDAPLIPLIRILLFTHVLTSSFHLPTDRILFAFAARDRWRLLQWDFPSAKAKRTSLALLVYSKYFRSLFRWCSDTRNRRLWPCSFANRERYCTYQRRSLGLVVSLGCIIEFFYYILDRLRF